MEWKRKSSGSDVRERATGKQGEKWHWLFICGALFLTSMSTEGATWSFDVDSTLSGEGDSTINRRKGVEFGSFSEIHAEVEGVATWQLSDTFDLRLGADWERFSFLGLNKTTPIPGTLESANLVLGFDDQITPSILFHLDIKPGFFGDLHSLSTSNFNIPVEMGGAYFVSTSFQLLAGVGIDINRNLPVVPFVGFRWQVNDKWLLDGKLPKPQVVYQLTDQVSLHAGASFLDSAYRMSANFGRAAGIQKLSNSVLTYEEVRVGGGVSWKVNKAVSLDLEAGCVPYRKFDYDRASYSLRSTDVAPYGELGLSFKF